MRRGYEHGYDIRQAHEDGRWAFIRDVLLRGVAIFPQRVFFFPSGFAEFPFRN